MISRSAAVSILKVLVGLGVLVGVAFGLSFWGRAFVAAHPTSVVRVTHADEKLQDAMRESRKELPKFEGRLKHPEPGDHFAIKGRFSTPNGPEYLWLKDPKAAGDGFLAVVDQSPFAATTIHRGEHVHVAQKDVVDWLIQRADGSRAGGATDLALGATP